MRVQRVNLKEAINMCRTNLLIILLYYTGRPCENYAAIKYENDELDFTVEVSTLIQLDETTEGYDALLGSGSYWKGPAVDYVYYRVTINEPSLDITIMDFSFSVLGAKAVLIAVGASTSDWVTTIYNTTA